MRPPRWRWVLAEVLVQLRQGDNFHSGGAVNGGALGGGNLPGLVELLFVALKLCPGLVDNGRGDVATGAGDLVNGGALGGGAPLFLAVLDLIDLLDCLAQRRLDIISVYQLGGERTPLGGEVQELIGEALDLFVHRVSPCVCWCVCVHCLPTNLRRGPSIVKGFSKLSFASTESPANRHASAGAVGAQIGTLLNGLSTPTETT